MNHKMCTSCRAVLKVEKFALQADHSTGYASSCKMCMVEKRTHNPKYMGRKVKDDSYRGNPNAADAPKTVDTAIVSRLLAW